MQQIMMIGGLVMLMALPPLFAEPGDKGYGAGMDKSRDSGMMKSGDMDKGMDKAKGMGMDKAKDMGMDKDMGTPMASVAVTTPADGAVLSKSDPVSVSYQATTGPKGDHVHIYVNGKREAVLRELSGSHSLGMLSPGMHKISVEVVAKDHQHIGVGKEVSVDVR